MIASQAVISGAFSVARQAVQMGFLPRMLIVHTSGHAEGQIYVPFTNWTLYLAVVALVVGFRNSSNLAAAYGIAVTGNDADRHHPGRFRDGAAVALAAYCGGAGRRFAAARRSGVLRRQPAQDPRRRLVSAGDGARVVHRTHHLASRPAAGRRRNGQAERSDARFSRCYRQRSSRQWHGGFHDQFEGGRSGSAAAQPQAQPGAPRAGRAGHRADDQHAARQ